MEKKSRKNAAKKTHERVKVASKKMKSELKTEKQPECSNTAKDEAITSVPINDQNSVIIRDLNIGSAYQPQNSVYISPNHLVDFGKSNIGFVPVTSSDYMKNLLTNTSAFVNIPWSTNNNLLYTPNFASIPIADSSSDQQIGLQEEITSLRKGLNDKLKELEALEKDNKDKTKALEELKKQYELLIAKERINHILQRICEDARKKLFEFDDFRSLFANSTNCDAVVVSIDIRRSTELMLKARTPELFSKFITELSQKLANIIILNYGIFDKFTGDGILAFFPDFYSGSDSIYFALKAAKSCHELFYAHYNNSRECFNLFLKDIGLGIGIDYGRVSLVSDNNELTVVGIPVVYACRLSAADAGWTLINQHAKEQVESLYSKHIEIIEKDLAIKNEGTAVTYSVKINEEKLNINKPDWDALIKKFKK